MSQQPEKTPFDEYHVLLIVSDHGFFWQGFSTFAERRCVDFHEHGMGRRAPGAGFMIICTKDNMTGEMLRYLTEGMITRLILPSPTADGDGVLADMSFDKVLIDNEVWACLDIQPEGETK